MVKKYLVKVLEKKNLAANYWWVKLERPREFEYKAGQYISLAVESGGLRRSYSLASWPRLDHLELVVDTTPMGVGSRYILGLKVGDEVEMLGPLGMMIDSGKTMKKMFVATGCGVVPLRSMVHDLLEVERYKEQVNLTWGMRNEDVWFWKDEFDALAGAHDNFNFDLVLSKPGLGWKGCTGHVQDCLVKHEESLREWEGYVCGNREMVEDVVEKLKDKGIEVGSIFRERFN